LFVLYFSLLSKRSYSIVIEDSQKMA
jgi:hypothetical protein